MKRLMLILVIVIVIGSASWGAAASEVTQIPHENPSTAESRFNFILPLLQYSEIFTQLAKRDYARARTLIQELELDFAHLPGEIIFIMARYNDLSTQLADNLQGLDAVLNECEQLLSQNRLDEASIKLDEARGLVSRAAEFVKSIDMATDELLRLLTPFVSSKEAEPVDKAKAELQEAVQRLEELEAWYRDMLKSFESEAEGKRELSITELTLAVSPAQVWVGDLVTISGMLEAEDTFLPARNVLIFLRGKYFGMATTRENGSYEASFPLPYWYSPEIEAWSFYLPQGDDKHSFRAASSEIKKIEVLFCPTTVKVEAPERVFPGLPAKITGKLSSSGNIINRNVKALLDGEPLFEVSTDNQGSFQHQVMLTEKVQVGEHRLSIVVAPDDKSSSAGSSVDKNLNVIKVTPEIDIDAPRFVVLPQEIKLAQEAYFPLSLQGKVKVAGEISSSLPLEEAQLTLEMAGVCTTTIVHKGDFELGIDLPLRIDTVGLEEMKLELLPAEPWYLSTRREVHVFVINLIYVAVVLTTLVLVAAVLFIRKRGILRKGREPLVTPQGLRASDFAAESYIPEIKPRPGDTKGIVLQAYYMAVAGVQALTSIVPKRQMTLREFLNRVMPSLGKLAGLFAKLTSLAEKALYSRYILGTDDASLARRLASEIRRGWIAISSWR